MSSPNQNELLVTGDESHTLVSNRYGVPYHSRHGAIEESRHVFLDAGLFPMLETETDRISILEMGFGTGLNALLVREVALVNPGVFFDYHTYELFPISREEITALNYAERLEVTEEQFTDLHEASWGESVELEVNFTLHKHRKDFLEAADHPTGGIDVVFYDAFAPNSQPELWSPRALTIAHEALRPGGLLTTYCAKGQFKRDLRAIGFGVEALPGPPGKREMTRGTRL